MFSYSFKEDVLEGDEGPSDRCWLISGGVELVKHVFVLEDRI